MICAWKELLSILPPPLRPRVDELGKDDLQELRLRLGKAPELVLSDKKIHLTGKVLPEDIHFVVNTASRYSPWAAASASSGYITAPGGHRIGLCGEAVIKDGAVQGIRSPTSLCIRIARDFPGIGVGVAQARGNILILGPPGTGKTTLLRDLIRQLKETVTVVDERGEIFPVAGNGYCFETGLHTDVLTGCSKRQGIAMALRTMGPACIAVDEITETEDCRALTEAGWCGVRLIATAHASSTEDLKGRKVYRPLLETGLFEDLFVLRKDKSWYTERMVAWH